MYKEKQRYNNSGNLRLRRVDTNNRLTSIWIICLLITVSFLGFIIFEPEIMKVVGTIIYVDDDYTFEDLTHKMTIQAAIDAAFWGDIVFVFSGNYTENVVVYKEINLTGEDRDTTIIDGGGNDDVVLITIDRVIMNGFTVTNSGSNPVGSDSGIELDNVQNCKVFENNVSNNGARGIYLNLASNNHIINNKISSNSDAGIHLSGSSNNNITSNGISYNSHVGIVLRGSSSNNITNNNVLHNNGGGIDLGGSSNTITQNKISNNNYGLLIDGNQNYIFGNIILMNDGMGVYIFESSFNNIINNNISTILTDGINLYYSSNNTIIGNSVSTEYFLSHGIFLYSSPYNIIFSNTVFSNEQGGIYLSWSDYNDIRFNSVSMNGASGISLETSNYNNVTNNKAMNNLQFGIHLLGSSTKNNIANNDVSSNFLGGGIYLDASHINKIIANDVYMNPRGINNFASSGNNISGNNVFSNVNDGIYIEISSDNEITNNNISNNFNGIYLNQSPENNITDNLIFSNDRHGIHLFSSSANRIYHNKFIDNVLQAFDDRNDNLWNNTYPSGGNYWSDFDESKEGAYDDYQGPDQDVDGSDGIVDNGTVGGGGKNPYVIDPDSQDNYPLIFGNYTYLYEGWNLISIPLIQSNTKLSSVLSSIEGFYDAVQWYNASDKLDSWKHNHTAKPQSLNDLHTLDHKMGFWIHIIEPGWVIFEYSGTPPMTSQGIQLHPGWNLVGYPSLTSYNRTDGLNNTEFGTHIDGIYWYDTSTRTWHNMQKSDYFERGQGYWIHAIQGCVWEVPL